MIITRTKYFFIARNRNNCRLHWMSTIDPKCLRLKVSSVASKTKAVNGEKEIRSERNSKKHPGKFLTSEQWLLLILVVLRISTWVTKIQWLGFIVVLLCCLIQTQNSQVLRLPCFWNSKWVCVFVSLCLCVPPVSLCPSWNSNWVGQPD